MTESKPRNRLTRKKLEQCAVVVDSYNGPNFAFARHDDPEAKKDDKGWDKWPDDFIHANTLATLKKTPMEHGVVDVQGVLRALWPYPVCADGKSAPDGGCTTFPLPVAHRDDDGGFTGDCIGLDGKQMTCPDDGDVDLSFLKDDGGGVIDYHCSWALIHAVSFNGPPVLRSAEREAFEQLIAYLSGQFDCKVCRNNFNEIIHHYGMPTGNIREDYAKWFWQAHNNANEHSCACILPASPCCVQCDCAHPRLLIQMQFWFRVGV